MIKENKVIVVDIDGTLTLGKKDNDSYETVRVCDSLKQRLIQLKSQEYWIILYTSRNMRTHGGNIGAIMKHTAPTLINWLADNEIPYDEIHFGKPWCGHDGFYVDDRAIRPKEFIENTMEELQAIINRDQICS
jgi:capsule biosynthesis phosphatase